MPVTKLPVTVLALTLWLCDLSGACAGVVAPSQSDSKDQSSKAILHMAKELSETADAFNYRPVRAYTVEPDEWDTDARRPLLLRHVYYTLFSREPESLLDLGPMHRGVSSKRVSAVILLFKDAESAGKELLALRKKLEGDIGAEVVRDDENGFEVRAVLRSHVAVRRGAKVILFETDKQVETMSDMATKLGQAS